MALADGLIFYYACEDNAANALVTNELGVPNGTASANTSGWSTTGKENLGFQLNGASDYINTNQNVNASTSDYSFRTWLNLDDLGTAYTLFSSDPNNTAPRGFQCDIQTNGSIRIFDGTTVHASSAGVISASTDYHIVFVLDGVNSKIWVNGSNVKDASASYGNKTEELWIAQSKRNSQYVDGMMDEIAGWDRALSDAEVATDYNSGAGSFYPFTTGTNMQINIGDVWKPVDALKINIGDVWKNVVAVKQNIGDVWKDVF